MASKVYTITRKQSLLDACIQVYGTSKLLFQFAKDNSLQIDSEVNIGDNLIYDDSLGIPKMKKKLSRNEDIIANKGVSLPVVYNDWFLPSKDELNQMYINLHLFGLGDFDINFNYWSSSEFTSLTAFRQIFTNGTQTADFKNNTNQNVRACRSFISVELVYNLRDIGPAGGLIFYINGTTYYEASPKNLVIEDQFWSNIINVLVGTNTAIGTGLANTDAIIAQPGHINSAAKLCKDLIIEN